MCKQYVLLTALVVVLLALHPDNAFSQVDSNATGSSQELTGSEATETGRKPEVLALRLIVPVLAGAAIVATILVWKKRLRKA
jgi:hypothetical protein